MFRFWRIALLLIVVIAAAASVLFASRPEVKEPAVAGAFYPADTNELARAVDSYLANAPAQQAGGRLIALIAPHAGYVYSGQVAAYTYRKLAGSSVDTVVLIGASHYAAYSGASVYAEGGMRTPLGVVKVNAKIARSLLDERAGVTFFREAFAKEHSLEVQLPFLQRSLKEVTVVPILMGAPTQASLQHLANRLTEIMRKNEHVIIVASTDLSHYHSSPTAVGKDRKVIDAISRMSLEELQGLLASNEGEACGGVPVLLTMMVGRNLGATNGVLFKYANSGDVSGDRSRVVGYAAMGLYKSPLSGQQQQELLALARTTIIDHVSGRRTPERETEDARLRANGATFVTINRNHMLRGCIGNIQPVMPLNRSVATNAIAASSRDPRFPPMRPEELADMEVEVTILSPLETTDDPGSIVVGTHGVYLEKDGRAAVFLPQVPVEQGWDRKTYLEQLCAKAGLPKDAWKAKDAKISVFTADIVK